MKPQLLRYIKPDGSIGTAYVFTDEHGIVQAGTGLIELAGALQRVKRERLEAAVAPSINQPLAYTAAREFFDLTTPCTLPSCNELRAQYQQELEASTSAGCTGCEKSAIRQKYHKLAMALAEDTPQGLQINP